jgi:hypothetical protein
MPLEFLADIETRVGPLKVYHGYDANVLGQLVEKSRSARMVRTVPGDSQERFRTINEFNDWAIKEGGRWTYPALDHNRRLRRSQQPELAAFLWLGKAAFPHGVCPLPPELRYLQPNHTYAIRSYGLPGDETLEAFYADSGAAKRLSQLGIAHYAGQRLVAERQELAAVGMEPAIFLETDADNPARTGLYPHLYGVDGFMETGTYLNDRQKERVSMVLPLSLIAAHGIPVPHGYSRPIE